MSKLLFVPVALALAIFAIANRGQVDIDLWPLPQSIGVPLYAAVFGAALVGFLIGAVVTWYSAWTHRLRARRALRRDAPPAHGFPAQPGATPTALHRPPVLARYRAAVDEA